MCWEKKNIQLLFWCEKPLQTYIVNELSELSKQFQTFCIHETGYTSPDSKQLIENIQDLIAERLSGKKLSSSWYT